MTEEELENLVDLVISETGTYDGAYQPFEERGDYDESARKFRSSI